MKFSATNPLLGIAAKRCEQFEENRKKKKNKILIIKKQ
jgi:hypothetical protein